MRKLRTNAGDKDTSSAKEVSLAEFTIRNMQYLSIIQSLEAKAFSDVVVYSNDDTAPNYAIMNIELEYSCIASDDLARKALTNYQKGKVFMYENILLHKKFTISKPNDGVINENINIPRKSMTGILCLFTDGYAAGTSDSEAFANPKITSININVDERPNRLYSKGMVPTDFHKSVIKRFGVSDSTQTNLLCGLI